MRDKSTEQNQAGYAASDPYSMHTPGRFGTAVIMQNTDHAFLVSHSHWEQGFRLEERIIFYKPIDSLDEFFKEVLPIILDFPEHFGLEKEWTPAELGDLFTGMYFAALKVSPGHAKTFRSCLVPGQRADLDAFLAMIKKNAKAAERLAKYGGGMGH